MFMYNNNPLSFICLYYKTIEYSNLEVSFL